MGRIIIDPGGAEFTVDDGTLILDVLTDRGQTLPTPCGGKGVCGKCLVKADGSLSELTELESGFVIGKEGYRLACQAQITGDAVIHLEASDREKAGKTLPVDPESSFGIAVDIGTTSVKTAVVDHSSGDYYPVDSFLNPQRRYGHDVVSRIAASMEPSSRERLEYQIRFAAAKSIVMVLDRYSLSVKRLREIVFSGNTTMLYFMFGIEAAPLGVHPYEARWKDFSCTLRDINAGNPFEGLFLDCPAYGLEPASAYLGGDLVGGAAIIEREGFDDSTFFIDIGTNGEIYLHHGGKIYAASCAMGPALEGMNISCGMTADTGAINHFTDDGGALRYTVIGNTEPVGISGTGLIDIIAILLRNGLVKENGAFSETLKSNDIPIAGLKYREEDRSITITERVSVSQKDIRSIQLAKGASLAAGNMLLWKSGIDPDSIKHVIIAGAFGENLFIDNFKQLNFIPEFRNAEYLFLGNTSLRAASLYCHDEKFRTGLGKFRDSIRVIELTGSVEFNDTFMESFDFRAESYC